MSAACGEETVAVTRGSVAAHLPGSGVHHSPACSLVRVPVLHSRGHSCSDQYATGKVKI